MKRINFLNIFSKFTINSLSNYHYVKSVEHTYERENIIY